MGAGTPEAPWVQIRPGVYAPPGSAPAPVSADRAVSAYSPLPNVGIAGPLPSSAPSLASVPVPVQPAPVYPSDFIGPLPPGAVRQPVPVQYPGAPQVAVPVTPPTVGAPAGIQWMSGFRFLARNCLVQQRDTIMSLVTRDTVIFG